MNQPESIAQAGAKSALPAALGGQLIFGYSLGEVAAVIGLVYTSLQLFFLIYDRVQKWRKEHGRVE